MAGQVSDAAQRAGPAPLAAGRLAGVRRVTVDVLGRGESALRAAGRAALLVATAVHARNQSLRAADDRCEQAHLLRRVGQRIADTHGLRIEVKGRLPAGPAVLVANHLSYLDPVAIASLAPVVPIAKVEVLAWPVLGAAMRDMGVLFVRRGDPYSGAVVLRRALSALRAGVSVLTFPEGTTTCGDRVLPFSRGIFGVARIAGVPVIPLAMTLAQPDACWVGEAPFLPHYLELIRRARTTIRLSVGKPIPAAASCSAALLAQRAERDVRSLLGLPVPGADSLHVSHVGFPDAARHLSNEVRAAV